MGSSADRIGHIKPNIDCPDLEAIIARAVDTVTVEEREVRDNEGKTHLLRVRPYKSLDNRIDGAVVALFDVSEAREAALQAARGTGEAVMSSVRQPILQLDQKLTIERANRDFCELFQVEPAGVEGKDLFEILGRVFDKPELRELFERVLPKQRRFGDYALDAEFPNVGRLRVVMDGWSLEAGRGGAGLLSLLIIREGSRGAAS